ncbi:MAG TPA: hypothetical protein VFX60_19210 [Micromonospora sp.]|nr:hypothetical protein [Micromonospora sp.]
MRDLNPDQLAQASREQLTDHIAQLQQDRADLLAALDETRAQLHAIGGMRIIHHHGRQLRVITAAHHDRLCRARVGTPQGSTPDVVHCAACGLCYPPPPTTTKPPEVIVDSSEYREWERQQREQHDRSTAANIRKHRENGTLGNVVAKQDPKTRKRIHDLDRRHNAGGPR